jgi:hypothetical protein
MSRWIAWLVGVAGFGRLLAAAEPQWLTTGQFQWTAAAPLVAPADRPEDPCHAIKDPTVVQFNGQWHVFCTIRSKTRTHQIEYLSFADWKDANAAPRHLLQVHDGYYCAPQVFYFTPQKKWYLVYQSVDKTQTPPRFGPAYSTSADLADAGSWTQTAFFPVEKPKDSGWIDFWVICDQTRAFLFFTSNNGQMWRAQTTLADFPNGWSRPVLCLQGDIFEASHTYKLKGLEKYLTLVEAQDGGRRYYKAYLAEALDGTWQELAATRQKPFAARTNVRQTPPPWTDSISHGELIRSGYDQTQEIDPARLRFLFQGVSDQAQAGKNYGDIPWKLGILEPAD